MTVLTLVILAAVVILFVGLGAALMFLTLIKKCPNGYIMAIRRMGQDIQFTRTMAVVLPSLHTVTLIPLHPLEIDIPSLNTTCMLKVMDDDDSLINFLDSCMVDNDPKSVPSTISKIIEQNKDTLASLEFKSDDFFTAVDKIIYDLGLKTLRANGTTPQDPQR